MQARMPSRISEPRELNSARPDAAPSTKRPRVEISPLWSRKKRVSTIIEKKDRVLQEGRRRQGDEPRAEDRGSTTEGVPKEGVDEQERPEPQEEGHDLQGQIIRAEEPEGGDGEVRGQKLSTRVVVEEVRRDRHSAAEELRQRPHRTELVHPRRDLVEGGVDHEHAHERVREHRGRESPRDPRPHARAGSALRHRTWTSRKLEPDSCRSASSPRIRCASTPAWKSHG